MRLEMNLWVWRRRNFICRKQRDLCFRRRRDFMRIETNRFMHLETTKNLCLEMKKFYASGDEEILCVWSQRDLCV